MFVDRTGNHSITVTIAVIPQLLQYNYDTVGRVCGNDIML